MGHLKNYVCSLTSKIITKTEYSCTESVQIPRCHLFYVLDNLFEVFQYLSERGVVENLFGSEQKYECYFILVKTIYRKIAQPLFDERNEIFRTIKLINK